jgi:hypothetical protein
MKLTGQRLGGGASPPVAPPPFEPHLQVCREEVTAVKFGLFLARIQSKVVVAAAVVEYQTLADHQLNSASQSLYLVTLIRTIRLFEPFA